MRRVAHVHDEAHWDRLSQLITIMEGVEKDGNKKFDLLQSVTAESNEKRRLLTEMEDIQLSYYN